MSQRILRRKRELKLMDVLYLLVIIVVFLVFNQFSYEAIPHARERIQYEIAQWTDSGGSVVDLNKLLPGDTVSLYADVGVLQLNDKQLCMKSVDTVFDVYADGELIYSYRPSLPKLLGVSYGMYVHTIFLPEDAQTLNIQAEPIFQTSYVTLKDVRIDDSGAYISGLFREGIAPFLMSAVTLLIGVLFVLLGLTHGMLSRSVGVDFFSFGLMCAMLGFQGLNDTYLLQFHSQSPALIRVLTYIDLMLVPYPAVAFFARTTGNKKSKLITVFLVLCSINFILSTALTTLGITDYYYMVTFSHITIVLGFASVVFFMVRSVRKHLIRPQLIFCFVIGFGVCVLGMGADLLRYHMGLFDGYSKYTRVSILAFMVIIAIYLFREQIRAMEQKQQENITFISEITESFAKVIDMKDQYTNGHSIRVAKYTAMLAKELGYNEETIEKYYRVALLHDIGKIGVPSEVLNKPGKLTDEEYEIIKAHSQKGYEVLENISIMPELAIGAGSHHERPDGKGYPNGLKGDEIPRVAQIIAVADTFDAMYSNRPYRKRMNFEKAVSIIKEASGTQLTEDVVAAFLRLVGQGEFRAADDTGGGTTENIDNIHKRLAEEAT